MTSEHRAQALFEAEPLRVSDLVETDFPPEPGIYMFTEGEDVMWIGAAAQAFGNEFQASADRRQTVLASDRSERENPAEDGLQSDSLDCKGTDRRTLGHVQDGTPDQVARGGRPRLREGPSLADLASRGCRTGCKTETKAQIRSIVTVRSPSKAKRSSQPVLR